MSADHDNELHDELLRRVVAELQKPVRLDPALDARALREIRVETRQAPARRRFWLGAAALAAGLFFVVLVRQPPPGSGGPKAPATVQVVAETRQVELRLSAPASSVTVVGDFNDWDPSGTPLRPTGRSGVWSVELRLKPGRYHYTFLIDGNRWAGDPSEPHVTSDFGAPVSVLTVS
jgi:Glycogen recognition site of AMP-activated protein kinase